MQKAAQRSQDSASSNHVALYGEGILIELLKTGGFVILEIDERGERAISLHVVSRASDGSAIVESNPVEGNVSAGIAEALTGETAAVIDALFATPINASALENKFAGGRFPKSQNSDDDETNNLFAVPSAIETVGASQTELRELAVLLGTIETWPIRYAISNPISPADPMRGLEAGASKLLALSNEFASGNAERLDISNLLQDLKAVRTREQLLSRLRLLRAFNEFLEQKSTSPDTLTTFAGNRSISTIPLKLGLNGPPDDSYAVMTACGIIVGWKVPNTGTPVVIHMAIAGD